MTLGAGLIGERSLERSLELFSLPVIDAQRDFLAAFSLPKIDPVNKRAEISGLRESTCAERAPTLKRTGIFFPSAFAHRSFGLCFV